MKHIKNTTVLAIIMMFFLLVIPSSSAMAASTRTKALKAYSKFLASHESTFLKRMPTYGYFRQVNNENRESADSFLTVDLDKNGIPELVTYHVLGYKNSTFNVYTYKKGKIKRLKEILAPTYTAPTSWWGITVYACSKKHLHLSLMNGVGRDDYVYYISNGKLSKYAENDDHWYINENIYKVKGRKTTAAKYNKAVKGCVQKKSLVSNNSANRKNTLK